MSLISTPCCSTSRHPTLHSHRQRHRILVRDSSPQVFRSGDFEIDGSLGQVGYLTITSQSLDIPSPTLNFPTVEEGGVTCRLFAATVRKGDLAGCRVILKAYPLSAPGSESDIMSANELRAYSSLQPPLAPFYHGNVVKLLGAFEVPGPAGTGAAEQWLVLRNDGATSLDQYARLAAEAFSEKRAVGTGVFWDRFDPTRALLRRRLAIRVILRGVLQGLDALHTRNWLHQSLGPTSVVISETDEQNMGRLLRVRLRDLAFAADMSDARFVGGNTLAEIWEGGSVNRESDPRDNLAADMWRRADAAGVDQTPVRRRAFGVADDIFQMGLLVLYTAFVPFSAPGDVDGSQLQRLLETTFKLDVDGFREYCEADDRWREGVAFLAAEDGAGWELVGSMVQRDWSRRPTAASCLNNRFLN